MSSYVNYASKKADDYLGHKPVAEGSTTPQTAEGQTMRAITFQASRKMAVETVPRPALSHEKDVIIKVTSCTICSGSDGHIYAGEIPTTDKHLIVGHEGMGVIEQVGSQVKNFQKGDRVVISFSIACGECDHCKKEQYTGCEVTNDDNLYQQLYGKTTPHAALFGYSRLLGNVPGSQAEYVRVPFADVNCYKVPKDVPDDKALYLADVACTALHSVDLANVKKGDTVGIWGLGPIGLLAARWCQIRGAKRIIGIDLVPDRIEIAKKQLGIEVVDRKGLSSAQLCEHLLKLAEKGFDSCIEAVGFRFAQSATHQALRGAGLETDTPEMIDECMTCAKPYGTISLIGDYIGYAHGFPVGKIVMKHLYVAGGQAPCQKYFKYIMDEIQKGEFDPGFIVTNRIGFEDIPEAYEKLHKKEPGWLKVYVKL